MLHLFRAPTPAIGLDVGSESIKMLQLATGPGGLRVAAAVCVAIPADAKGDPDRRTAFAGETVRQLFRQGGAGFNGRRVVAALPKELLHYKPHRLQAMDAEEVSMAGRIDARDLFRFDPDSADVQCIDAGEVCQGGDRRREVILVAAGKQYVNDFVIALDRAGARVESLDIDPCALWRAASRTQPQDGSVPSPRVLLDVGAAQSRLVIGHGDAIRVVKTIDVGADHIRSAISRKLGLPAAEAEQLRRRAAAAGPERLDGVRKVLNDATRHVTELLARDVLACVRYHAVTFRGPAPRRVELLGGDANDPQIRSTLSATLLLPAKPVDLFCGIDVTAIPADRRTETLGEWAVALGLALKRFPGRLEQPARAGAGPESPEEPAPVRREPEVAGVTRE